MSNFSCCILLTGMSIVFDESLDTDSIYAAASRLRDEIVTGDIEYEVCYGDIEPNSKTVRWRAPALRDRIVFDRRDGYHAFLERWMPGELTFLTDGQTLRQSDGAGGNTERIIVRPDFAYTYRSDPLNNGEHLAVLEYSMTQPLTPGATLSRPDRRVFQPWNIGVIPDVIESSQFPSFEAVVRPAPGKQPVIASATLNGTGHLAITFNTADDRVVTVWHNPSRSMAVARIEMEGTNSLGQWRNSLSNDVHSYDDGGVFFPSEVILQSELTKEDGLPFNIILQRVRVLRGRFNFDIPSEKFSVSSLVPVAHTNILRQYDSADPMQEWDGEKLTTAQSPVRRDGVARPVGQPRRFSMRLLLLVTGNAFLVLGCVIYWWLRRQHYPPDTL